MITRVCQQHLKLPMGLCGFYFCNYWFYLCWVHILQKVVWSESHKFAVSHSSQSATNHGNPRPNGTLFWCPCVTIKHGRVLFLKSFMFGINSEFSQVLDYHTISFVDCVSVLIGMLCKSSCWKCLVFEGVVKELNPYG